MRQQAMTAYVGRLVRLRCGFKRLPPGTQLEVVDIWKHTLSCEWVTRLGRVSVREVRLKDVEPVDEARELGACG